MNRGNAFRGSSQVDHLPNGTRLVLQVLVVRVHLGTNRHFLPRLLRHERDRRLERDNSGGRIAGRKNTRIERVIGLLGSTGNFLLDFDERRLSGRGGHFRDCHDGRD